MYLARRNRIQDKLRWAFEHRWNGADGDIDTAAQR